MHCGRKAPASPGSRGLRRKEGLRPPDPPCGGASPWRPFRGRCHGAGCSSGTIPVSRTSPLPADVRQSRCSDQVIAASGRREVGRSGLSSLSMGGLKESQSLMFCGRFEVFWTGRHRWRRTGGTFDEAPGPFPAGESVRGKRDAGKETHFSSPAWEELFPTSSSPSSWRVSWRSSLPPASWRPSWWSSSLPSLQPRLPLSSSRRMKFFPKHSVPALTCQDFRACR